ncbi:MAG: potassium channel protein [Actinobacteria bacterium]|nr:potassium channel protein [Actinomycetota bacterium]
MEKNNRQFYKRIFFSIAVLLSIYVIGFLGYMIIEKMTLIDALFMTTITISTVGFQLVKELSRAGTIFTIILIVTGTGTAAYIIVSLTDFILSEILLGRVQYRRVKRMISKLKNHYIICGLGRVGNEIANELSQDKEEFIVIDEAEKPIELCKQNNWPYIQGNASDDKILADAGLNRAKALFAALDTEPENVYVTLSAKAINPDIFIVARAKTYETIKKLERAGANRVVSPQIIGGKRMVALAKQSTIIEFLDTMLSPDNIEITLAEIIVSPGCKIDGLTIKDANAKYQFGALIVSVIEAGQKVLINKANANTLIKGGHTLIAVGTVKQIEKLSGLATSL